MTDTNENKGMIVDGARWARRLQEMELSRDDARCLADRRRWQIVDLQRQLSETNSDCPVLQARHEKLRARHEERGVILSKVQDVTGVSESQLRAWCAGIRNMSNEQAHKITELEHKIAELQNVIRDAQRALGVE